MHDDRLFVRSRRRGGFRYLASLARDVRVMLLDGLDPSTVAGRLAIAYRYVVLTAGLALAVPFSIAAIHWLVVNYTTNVTEQIIVNAALRVVAPACAVTLIARYRAPLFGLVARVRTWAESFGAVRRR